MSRTNYTLEFPDLGETRFSVRAGFLSSDWAGPRRRRGSAAVEFAVVAPLLFAVVLGLVEFGRAMMVQQTVVSAAREACRVAILPGTTRDDVIDRADASLSAAGIPVYTITMVPDPPSSAAVGTPVTVTIAVSFNNVTWLPVPIYLGGRNLTASSVMRREWD
jgi:Flp pilus assembly protein TadG